MYNVYLSYKGYAYEIDEYLRKLAKAKYRGEHVGSGYNLDKDRRDLHFKFYTKKNANNFRKAANRYLKKNGRLIS